MTRFGCPVTGACAQAVADALWSDILLAVLLWDERLNTTEARRHLDKLVHSCAPNSNGNGRTRMID